MSDYQDIDPGPDAYDEEEDECSVCGKVKALGHGRGEDECVDCAEAGVWGAWEECPLCRNGTVEVVLDEVLCRGECGNIWRQA